MSSKRKLRRRSCESKKRYESRLKAYDALYSARRRNGYRGGEVYKCKFCGGYHYGRMNKNQRKGYAQRRRNEKWKT